MNNLHREFPQSADSERGVLAAILLAPVEVLALCGESGVTRDTFYLPAHAELYATFCDIAAASKPVEFITIAEYLRANGKLETIGGPAYLNELLVLLPSAAYVSHHIEDLKAKQLLRDTITTCGAAAEECYGYGANAEEIAAALHGNIGKLIQGRSKRQTIGETLQEIVDEVREGRDETGIMHTGVAEIDDRLRLFLGDLVFITAPTSCGKTALGAQLALQYAMKGHRVAFYPLEMAQKRVLKRAIAQLGGHNADFVRKLVVEASRSQPALEAADKVVKEFMATARTLKSLKIHMRDDLHNWEHIRADLRMEHTREPFAYVLIDYLQLIQVAGRWERKQLMLAHITQSAKLLAKELNCIICIPSQVNEQGNTREARDAENDADALVKIEADPEHPDEPRPGRVSVWKQRDGERHAALSLIFNPLLTRFEPTWPGHPNSLK